MRYTTYYEDRNTIDYAAYELLKQNLSAAAKDKHYEEVTVIRKIQFENTDDRSNYIEGAPRYRICMVDNNKSKLYLEKKSTQNNLIYKACTLILKEECDRILDGDLDWMKNHKNKLLEDFHRQLTINGLTPGHITEYDRELIKYKSHDYIIINKEIRRVLGKNVDFFSDHLEMIDCLSCDKIHMTYKRETTLPAVVENILHVQKEYHNELALAL